MSVRRVERETLEKVGSEGVVEVMIFLLAEIGISTCTQVFSAGTSVD
jgi:hypothetical protein